MSSPFPVKGQCVQSEPPSVYTICTSAPALGLLGTGKASPELRGLEFHGRGADAKFLNASHRMYIEIMPGTYWVK